MLWLLLLQSTGCKCRDFSVAACGLSSYDASALFLQGMWDHPGSGIEPVSSALSGKFLSIAPPGKAQAVNLRFGGVVRENMLSVPLEINSKGKILDWSPLQRAEPTTGARAGPDDNV